MDLYAYLQIEDYDALAKVPSSRGFPDPEIEPVSLALQQILYQ